MKVLTFTILSIVGIAGCSVAHRPELNNPEKSTPPESEKMDTPEDKPMRISISVRDSDINEVYKTIAEMTGKRITVFPKINGTTTISVTDVPWDRIVDAIAQTMGYKAVPDGPDGVRVIHNN